VRSEEFGKCENKKVIDRKESDNKIEEVEKTK